MPSGSRGIPPHHPRKSPYARPLRGERVRSRWRRAWAVDARREWGVRAARAAGSCSLPRPGRSRQPDRRPSRKAGPIRYGRRHVDFLGLLGRVFQDSAHVVRLPSGEAVLSLKQANVVGRLAAMFMRGLTCVAFEHIAEYRARRFHGCTDRSCACCPDASTRCGPIPPRRSRRRAAISCLAAEGHVIPLFVAGGQRRSRPTMHRVIAFGLRLPEGSSRGRTVPLIEAIDAAAPGRRRCDAGCLRRRAAEAGDRGAPCAVVFRIM